MAGTAEDRTNQHFSNMPHQRGGGEEEEVLLPGWRLVARNRWLNWFRAYGFGLRVGIGRESLGIRSTIPWMEIGGRRHLIILV